MGIACTKSLSDGLVTNEGNIPLIAWFPTLFTIESNNGFFSFSAFSSMSLGINIDNDDGLRSAITVTKKKLMID